MDIERACIEILFHDVPIINAINYLKDNEKLLDFQDFYHISIDKFKQYSKDEVENIYHFLLEKVDIDNCATFFYALGKYCKNFLIYDEYEPKIIYGKLMRWEMMSHLLDQDLPITSYLAYRDYLYEDHTEFFAYRSIIRTNNHRLQNILSEGMAENHFHLKGSTKVFDINWLSLMNHPFDRDQEFKNFQYKLVRDKSFKKEHQYTLQSLVKIAAVLRMYLFLFINHKLIEAPYKKYEKDIYDMLDAEEHTLNDYMKIIPEGKNLVGFNGYRDLDYALKAGIYHTNDNGNYILSGERRLLYECIYQMILGNMNKHQSCFLYLYILIKIRFRDEIIQVNDRTGFENFSEYEQRKETFIERFPKYKDELIKLAVINTCIDQNVVSLEARITPKKRAIDNIKQIQHLDTLLNVKDGNIITEGRLTEFFYVYHFVKKKDVSYNKNEFITVRNYNVREDVKLQAKALAMAIEENEHFRKRIRGIDACNNEYFCRPEVFAQAFRFLNGSNFSVNSHKLNDQIPVTINITYHAGEDFLDVVDGLRAIDETILFCNLSNQSRIGHALALGIDVGEYYHHKGRLVLSELSFLDNISWLISKCNDFDIDMETSYLNKLRSEFEFVFQKVYKRIGSATINQYYDAWKLRGDNPELYENRRYEKINVFEKYDNFAENRAIKSSLRMNEKAVQIYHAYHFDEDVRIEGDKKYVFVIDGKYIDLVKKVQKKMQFDIAQKGIMIECNPTSNFYIAQLHKYENHPILNFYDYELTRSHNKNCAQLCVSINTDDQGVFDTSLENEYALMAYALENKKDENGENLYTPTEVYKWIDSVRKMGLHQKFN